MKKNPIHLNGWLNKFLKKYFKINIFVYNRSIRIEKTDEHYVCIYCKEKMIRINDIKNQKYAYRVDNGKELTMQDTIENDPETEVYGWVVESCWLDNAYTIKKGIKEEWHNHSNHKIYLKKLEAVDAINQLMENGYNKRKKFRIIPLYKISNMHHRDMLISKILEN